MLANLLVLHPAGRSRFAKAGGGEAIARGMAERDRNGKPLFHTTEEEDNTDRLFLLARIGFLVTMERKDVVEVMVDKEDIIDSLVHVSPPGRKRIADVITVFEYYSSDPDQLQCLERAVKAHKQHHPVLPVPIGFGRMGREIRPPPLAHTNFIPLLTIHRLHPTAHTLSPCAPRYPLHSSSALHLAFDP